MSATLYRFVQWNARILALSLWQRVPYFSPSAWNFMLKKYRKSLGEIAHAG